MPRHSRWEHCIPCRVAALERKRWPAETSASIAAIQTCPSSIELFSRTTQNLRVQTHLDSLDHRHTWGFRIRESGDRGTCSTSVPPASGGPGEHHSDCV